MSGDPTPPRLLAAASALAGAAFLMVRSEPSWGGVLIGLSCLAVWGYGTLAAKRDKPLRLTRPSRPRVLQAVIVETPRPAPKPLPAPASPNDRDILLLSTRMPEVPPHRQRMIERYTRLGR